MLNKYKISVILPVYKVEKYIIRALESLNNQTFKDFEIIIVDDFGEDNSIKLAQDYFKNDDRFKVYHNSKNMGTYHARRVGVENATGEYIVFLDPDDELTDEALGFIYEVIADSSKVDLLLFNIKNIPKLKIWTAKPQVPVGDFVKNIPYEILKEKKLLYGTAGKLYSRRILIEGFEYLSIPQEKRLVYGEDILIFASALLSTQYAVGISKELYVYHRNESSITEKKDRSSVVFHIDQLEQVILYLRELLRIREDREAISTFIDRVRLDQALLVKSIALDNLDYFRQSLLVLSRSPDWRNIAKLIVFFLTFTLKKF